MTIAETTTELEWGVMLTWPDGHVEYRRESGRALAEAGARMHNARDGGPSAEVVTRTVTATGWAVAS